MAPPCEVVLPTLERIPFEQCFSADDRELLTLAQILVKSDIATVEDWEQSGRDVAKYLSLTLLRWTREHGAVAVDRRFDLDLTSATGSSTTRMSEYRKERSI